MLVHFLASADRYGTTQPFSYLIANNGQLAMAAVYAMLAILCAATIVVALPTFNALRAAEPPTAALRPPLTVFPAAAATGLTVAGVFAIAGAAYHNVPAGPLLRWTLLASLPAAVTVAVIGVVAGRQAQSPAGPWHTWLRFPLIPLILAYAGMTLIQVAFTHTPYIEPLTNNLTAAAGAALIGISVALIVLRRAAHRAIAAPLLALTAATIVSWGTTDILGVVFVLAVTYWWADKAVRLALARWGTSRLQSRAVTYCRRSGRCSFGGSGR